jgi:hypothetical protein
MSRRAPKQHGAKEPPFAFYEGIFTHAMGVLAHHNKALASSSSSSVAPPVLPAKFLGANGLFSFTNFIGEAARFEDYESIFNKSSAADPDVFSLVLDGRKR